MLVSDRDDLVECIERPGVHVAGLGADDDRPIDGRELGAERVGPHPALIVGRDAADAVTLPTESQHLERGIDRHV